MIKQFARYFIAGGIAAIAHFLVLILLVEYDLVTPTVASGIGFCIAGAINYSLQYHFTFRASGPHQRMIARYALVTLAMLLVNLALFWTLTEIFGVYYIVAQVIATGLVVLLNFFLNRQWTFA